LTTERGGPELPPGGIELGDPPWRPWSPQEAARRLGSVRAPWYVAGGWALDLFLGRETPETASRVHEDLEVAVPAAAWPEVAAALSGLTVYAAGSGRLWPLADPGVDAAAALAAVHQTWVFDPAGAAFVLDVFREPHTHDTRHRDQWICRRDPTLRVPYPDLIARTASGIPYLRPEWVLLFKAKSTRPKDEADLEGVRTLLDDPARRRVYDLIARIHPGHPWLDRL
jgi:hypothetical protein